LFTIYIGCKNQPEVLPRKTEKAALFLTLPAAEMKIRMQ
jgi:hypothetical protein